MEGGPAECYNSGHRKCTGQFGQNCLGQTWSGQSSSGQTLFWPKFVGQTWFWAKFVWPNFVLAKVRLIKLGFGLAKIRLAKLGVAKIIQSQTGHQVFTFRLKPAEHEVVRHQSSVPGASRCFESQVDAMVD